MKTNLPFSLSAFLIIVLFYSTQSFSQWVQTKGPEGGTVKEIVKVEDKLILSTSNNIYASIDNGNSWNVILNNLPTPISITGLIEHNGTLYCSLYNKGIYKSLDGGSSWVPSNVGIENETFYTLIVFDNKIVAGLANGGAMFSPDNGATWFDRSVGVQEIQFTGIARMDNKIYAAGGSNSVPQEFPVLYVSDNDGEIWTPIEVPYLDSNGLTAVFVDETDLYVADVGHVYLSKDEGQTWQQTTLSTFATIKGISKFEDSIYATTSNGRYYVTQDEGSIWTVIKNEQSSEFINDLYISNDTILMSTSSGIYQSFDDGATWNINNTGITSLWIRTLAANSEYIFAGSAGQGVFRSNDKGETWEAVNNGLEDYNNKFINNLYVVDDNVFVGTGNGVLSSNDNGETWVARYIPNSNDFTGYLYYENDLFILLEGSRNVLFSRDKTETWESLVTSTLPQNTGLTAVTSFGDIILVGTNDGQIFSTNDFGITWQNLSIPISHHYVKKLQVHNEKFFAATSQGLLVTSDLGVNWSRYVAYDTQFTNDVIFEGDTVYVGTVNGVMVSDAETDTWHSFNDGLTNLRVISLLMHEDQFFIGTEFSSVFKIDNSEISLALLDYDNDGVINKYDLCSDTVQGVDVNEYGCDLVPLRSIRVLATSPTCPTIDNGSIEIISSMLGYDYTIKLIGQNLNQEVEISNWSGNYLVNDLPSGRYQVFITIPSIKHEEEFGVSVSQVNTISGKHHGIDITNKSVSYVVSGSTSYKVNFNGMEKEYNFGSTDTQNIVISDLKPVNEILILGLSDCQGKIQDTILMEDKIVVYPSISTGNFTLTGHSEKAVINVFNSNGQVVLSKNYNSGGSETINLDDCAPGMYFIKVLADQQIKTFKVIKR